MRLSATNLAKIRAHPQENRLFLSIFSPRIVLQCRVNDAAIAKGARSITFNNTTFGSRLAVEAGMILYIGTSLGAKDIGFTRIKSITSTVITVAENSNIEWADNQYLTVMRFFPILPVYPRIINDPNNVEDVIFYKDYDVAYTNQNTVLGTFVNMGSHRAAFIENGSADVWYTTSGTYSLNTGTVLSYNWAFEGGSPTGSTLANPGYVSYNTPGHYVTRLIVAGSNGESDTSYRYVSIYNQISSGTNLPYLQWSLDNMDGSRDEGGYTASITVYQPVEAVEEGSVVVLFANDWYATLNQSFGGNGENNSKIFFVGYVMDGSIRYDYEKSTVKFDVGSITRYIKEMEGFSVSVESHSAPTKWFQLYDLDIEKALYHYLRWHSTVLTTVDFDYLEHSNNNPKIQYFDADRSSLFDAVDNFMRSAVVGKTVADRQGKIWAETDITLFTTGTFSRAMSISNRDWMDQPTIDEQEYDTTSYLEMGGIKFSGIASGTFSALMAMAPGGAPSYRGGVERTQGLALTGQAQLNRIVQNLFAFKNYRFQNIDMSLTGKYTNLDIAPQEPVNITIEPEDTVRRVNIRNDFNVNSMSWEYDPVNTMLLPRVNWSPIVNGTHIETIVIPDTPDAGGYNTPPIQVPNIPAMSWPSSFPTSSPTGSSCCDALEIIKSPYSITLTRGNAFVIPDDPAVSSYATFAFETASNSRMYDPLTLLTALQNTGTASSLTIDVTCAVNVLANDHYGTGYIWALRADITDNAGTSLTAKVGYSLLALPVETSDTGWAQSFSGHFVVGTDFGTLSQWINNRKIRFFARSGIYPPSHFSVALSSLTITIRCTP